MLNTEKMHNEELDFWMCKLTLSKDQLCKMINYDTVCNELYFFYFIPVDNLT